MLLVPTEVSGFDLSLSSFFWEVVDLGISVSCGRITTGAAGMVSQRSFNKAMNLLTISRRNSSSLVKKSNRRNDRMYLDGIMRSVVAAASSTTDTSVVTCK